MAFVQVPKDLSKVKTKIAMNLTKRQIICFGSGAIIGIPSYLALRKGLGNEFSMFLMIIIMMPFFFTAIFEKDGMPLEKYMKYIIRQKYLYPKVRLYKTQNFYEFLNGHKKERQVQVNGGKSPGKRTTKKIGSKPNTAKKTKKGSKR